MIEELQIRTYGNPNQPALVYLPGLHGDWTLVGSFRSALKDRVYFVEMTYPRTLTWHINDYADAIRNGLLKVGLTEGWLLGESFGSQPAWALLEQNLTAQHQPEDPRAKTFQVKGLILAGGFVKHPLPWGPAALRLLGRMTPMAVYNFELKLYSFYSRFRHRRAPEVLGHMNEFVSRRNALDRKAMSHRLKLIDAYDPRPIARQTRVPIHYLAGLVDPLVPWMHVRWWLRRNCPGYQGGKTIWSADHNVLATSPARAADVVVDWMNETTHASGN